MTGLVDKNERAERVVELKYDDYVKKMRNESIRCIHYGFFIFRVPKFWNDDRKIIYVTKKFRAIFLICISIALSLSVISLLINDKKRAWELYTFNQDGEIRWVTKIEKLR